MALTAAQIHGFSELFLKKGYDGRRTTPPFHKEMWEMCCSSEKQVAIAAPRSHAKSTAITHAYTLANIVFREKRHIVIVSATEALSVAFLGDIKNELLENQDLRDEFGFQRLLKESETEIVGAFEDGFHFRIVAKGSGQRPRGLKWRNTRPDLIVCDDLEDDEQILNKERRDKLKKWFKGALVPALSKTGVIRVVGTVLHFDSLLESLLNSRAWLSKRYRAHNEDFSFILWPEQWSEADLRAKRQELTDDGTPELYAQEYLNHPIDESTAFFKRGDIVPISNEDENLSYYFGIDLAVSTAQRADFTVIAVVGVNPTGRIKVVDIRRGRWDPLTTIEELFSAYQRYSPETIVIERGAIEKAIGPFLYAEMNKRGVFMNLRPETPTKDKISRAHSLQARMRAGGVEFDKEADWYPELEEEFLRFPRGKHDDIVDAVSWIGLVLDKLVEAPTNQELEDEEWEELFADEVFSIGRSAYTGY